MDDVKNPTGRRLIDPGAVEAQSRRHGDVDRHVANLVRRRGETTRALDLLFTGF